MAKLAKSMKFQIGDRVLVKATASSVIVYEHEKLENPSIFSHLSNEKIKKMRLVRKENLPNSIEAVITGMKRFQEGEVFSSASGRSYSYDGDEDYYIPGGINVIKTVILWEFRRGLINKPEYAFEEDIEEINTQFGKAKVRLYFPYFYPGQQPEWNDRLREEYSKAAKGQPRDKRGRFIKYHE